MRDIEQCPPIPPDCKPLSNQVAGHVHGQSKRKLGLLERANEILKPVEATPIGERELIFYESLSNSDDDRVKEVKLHLLPFISNYYGVYRYDNVRYLRLQNICHGYRFPSVIDLKIGKQTWDPNSSEEQILRKRRKYPPCEQLGFQITGFQRYYAVGSGKKFLARHEKRCLRQLSANEMLSALALFFANNREECAKLLKPNKQIIRDVLHRLSCLYEAMQKQRSYLFYATSLLIVYESCMTLKRSKYNGFNSARDNKSLVCKNVAVVDISDQSQNVFDDHINAESTLTSSSVDNDDCSTETLYCCEPLSSIDHLSSETDKTSKDENCKYSQSSSTLEEITQDFNKSFDTTSNCSQNRCNKPIVDVRLIDFVHVYPNENPDIPDENFLYGLHSLINYLETLLKPGFVCRKLPQFSSCLIDDVTTCCVTDVN